MKTARFITLEGGEGGGKSTQVRYLADALRDRGHDVVVTREPGGTEGAEAIRALLVTGAANRWDATSEALLNYAARHDHLEGVIRPALDRGAWVLCDRFLDSTRAYQGIVGGLDKALLDTLETSIVGLTMPDLTLILDLDASTGLSRAGRRVVAGETEDRFEGKGIEFHRRLRQAFLDIAAAERDRCVVIDATAEESVVAGSIWKTVTSRLAP